MRKLTQALASGFYVCILSTTTVSVIAAPRLGVQIGAYSSLEQANAQADLARTANVGPVEIRKEATVDNVLFKVVVGAASSRSEAETQRDILKDAGFEGFIREKLDFGLEAVTDAIEHNGDDFFSTGTLVDDKHKGAPLPAGFAATRAAALSGPTTAPETLKAIADYIKLIPDSNPGKAREINMLAHRTFSGKSAYRSQSSTDLDAARSLLMKVANGQIAVRKPEQAEARALVCHFLHYYDQDYPAALRAYKQVLNDQLSLGNMHAGANTRAEIAAAALELTRKSGYEFAKLQNVVTSLWEANLGLIQEELTRSTSIHPGLAVPTMKLELMLTEIMLHQKNWRGAVDMSIHLEEMFSDVPAAKPYLLESYCHRAEAGINLGALDITKNATDKGLATLGASNLGLWGATEQNVAYKLHSWKLGMMQKFGYSMADQAAFKRYAHRRFRELPMLAGKFEVKE